MQKIVVANWKMNPLSVAGAEELFNLIENRIGNLKNTEVVICPPFVYLPAFQGRDSIIKLGAQNCFWEEKGAYTGEISARMIEDMNCRYVILGHSERQKYLGETDEMINRKIKTVLKTNLSPILLIGETRRNSLNSKKEIEVQLESTLMGIEEEHIRELNIVYEPLWAISSQQATIATVEDVIRAKSIIKEALKKLKGEIAKQIRILYGGSVDSENILDFVEKAGMKGVIVGRASLDPEEFVKIVKLLDDVKV